MSPAQGPKKAAAAAKPQISRSPAASYEAMRVQMLTVASWALAGSGWAYVLLPRLTLDALFVVSGESRQLHHFGPHWSRRSDRVTEPEHWHLTLPGRRACSHKLASPAPDSIPLCTPFCVQGHRKLSHLFLHVSNNCQ